MGQAIPLSLSVWTMNSQIRSSWKLGLALAVLPFIGGHPVPSYSQPTDPLAAEEPAAADAAPATPAIPTEPESTDEGSTGEGSTDAPVTPITTQKTLPPGLQPSAPVTEILKLVDSGVDEAVLLAFVTNSATPFQLNAEQIIYLNDIGIPSAVVTAMIQRDQVLKASATNAVAVAPTPAPEAPPPPPAQPAPPPAELAPQVDPSAAAYVPPVDDSYAPFYDSLAPYGTWVNVAGYGPCWQPTVVVINRGWRPYCDGGRWVYSDCGWYWLSGYSWGWAPFHYGRWFNHSSRGWCWQPGTTWGPSWVNWRYSGSYCGWAPLPPAAGFNVGIGLTYHGQSATTSFGFGLGVSSYTFVPMNHLADPQPRRYALSHQHAAQIYGQTTPSAAITASGNRVINHGVPVSRVASASRTPIHQVSVRDGTSPNAFSGRRERFESRNGSVSTFRPNFTRTTSTQSPSRGRPQVTPAPAPVSAPAPTTPVTSPRRTTDSGTRRAEPIILRGSDRSRETENHAASGAFARSIPANSLILSGRNDPNRGRPTSHFSSSQPQVDRPPVTLPQTTTRPQASVTPRTPAPAAPATPATESRPRQVWTAPRQSESPFHVQRSAPTQSAPLQVPRAAPPPAHTYSAPAPAPAPRQSVTQPQSTPSQSYFSAPARQSSASSHSPFSSNGRQGR